MSGSQQLLLGGSVQQAVDPFFYSVTSLLHGDGTNGGQNNTFLDSSTNNFTITRNGNTTQGSFSPFSQTGWSNYFNGPNTGSYLRTPASTDFQLGTSDFTIEFWAYTTDITSDTTVCQTDSGGSGFFGMLLNYSNGTNITWYATSNGSSWNVINGGVLCSAASIRNTWTHFAYVRNGSTFTAYVNGIAVYTTTSSASIYQSANQFVFGSSYAGSHPSNFGGYLSNFRYVKGTAVYTSNFTPSTTPLTAITNTKLLSCQANRFLDASASAHTLTVGGSPSVQPFSPFNPTTAYSTSAIGGSGYFDGSGDYVSAATASALQLTNAVAWTIEFWFYANAMSTQQFLLHGYDPNSPYTGYGIGLGTNGNPNTTLAFWDGTTWRTIATGLTPSQWYHVAISYEGSGTTGRMFLNGTQQGSAFAPASTINNTSNAIAWGAQNNNILHLNGYISGARIVKGTAVYTASFTAPTAPPTAITNTSLLLNFTNGAIFDNAAVADYETVGNAQISTSVKKYGTGSMYFDGTGDYLMTNSPSTDLQGLGSGDFTVEFWLYANTVSSIQTILDWRDASTVAAYPLIAINSDGTILWSHTNNTRITSAPISASTWYHVAVCRVAGQTKMFINGSQNGSTYADSTTYLTTTGAPRIGQDRRGAPSYYLNGYIDDLRISKGIGRYPYNFTPPTAEFPNIGGTVTLTADPYFDYTTLLLPGNGTNGAQNNTFLDGSTNNFTITRNGNTTQGTFSPFSQTGWGNYFDGTGDYLTAANNTAFQFGTGDFTVEGWFYLTSSNSSQCMIDFRGASNSPTGFFIGVVTSGYFQVYSNTNIVYVNASIGLNQWYHFAIARSGTTLKAFVNGTEVASVSNSTNWSDQSCSIGRSANTTELITGYQSNIRVVKGTALYTSSFTPSTTPLTAVTNTSLLTCQSNRFIDNSSNAFAITRNGDVSVQAFSPFNPTASWSAATYGGSGYFDGSGDTLSVAYNAALQLTSSTVFTIEGFVYFNSTGAQQYVLSNWTTGGAGYAVATGVAAFGNTELAFFDGTTWRKIGDVTVGQWYHFAIASSGTSNSAYLYLNGVQTAGAFTVSSNISNGSTGLFLMSQNNSSAYTNGYLSTFRVVKGTNVYPSGTTFTPPTAPLTAITNTSLLCNFTNAGIYDATSKNDLETVGNAQISTTQSKFGGSSMYFDGTGDYLYKPSDAITAISGDFTIEAWVYRNTNTTHPIADVGDYALSTGLLFYISNTNALAVFTNNASLISGGTIAATTWTHVAVVRYGSTVSLYVNGISVGTPASNTASFSGRLQVGADFYSSSVTNYFNGYIDDLRITKGIARYTSNFTPPTTAFLTL